MEKMETNNKTVCRLSISAAVLLIFGGVFLCGYLLRQLPTSYGLTIGLFILWEAVAIAPIIIGGAWLRNLYRKRNTNSWRKGTIGGIVFGGLLVITGLLLFAFNSGTVMPEWKPVTISWQMLLITLGIINLWRPGITSGMILISVGTFFIIPRIGEMFPDVMDINPDFIVNYWPILIAIAGVSVILGLILRYDKINNNGYNHRGRRCNCHRDYRKTEYTKSTASANVSGFAETAAGSDGKVNFSLVFSGSEHIFFEPVFRGGNISAVFGGMSLDLRRTTLPEGVTYLKVESIFGGVEIKAPEEWNIEIQSHSVFGGFSDSRTYYKENDNDNRKLVIIAECVFGGGEVE